MKIADLYVRVSTDEQADKGYSQRNQDEVLRKYCEINSIKVRHIIFEDHSAKSFNRPQWAKLLANLKKEKGKSDLILFTKWDRFSRNAGDAYQMISTLRRLGIEPQAVEQPLDLTIPENKMMLAFYLAAPEVENDRRALNVFFGMRRAKKEGRCMGIAPIGYANKVDESGKKYITPDEKEAPLVRWVFDQVARGTMATDQIRKEVNKKGLRCSRSNFWTLVRNPVYCGKIFIPKYKDEESYFVEGLHTPLISQSLYYDVQDILDGKKRKERPNTKVVSLDNLPLRGFLTCPKCGRMLTGSASKGKTKLYYYYHCIASCGCRYRADSANELFVEELKKYQPNAGFIDIYSIIIRNGYKKLSGQLHDSNKQILEEINRVSERLAKARELLLSGDIDAGDYRTIKSENETKMVKLEAKLSESARKSDAGGVEKSINGAISALSKLDTFYEEGDISTKRTIISSIFPEKLSFDGSQYRTPRINEAAQLIYTINNQLDIKKNRKEFDFSNLSGQVASPGIELSLFVRSQRGFSVLLKGDATNDATSFVVSHRSGVVARRGIELRF